MTNTSPFFTIVTVCYNDVSRLARTIESVAEQNFKNFEYVIIDGGSKDKTVEFIKKAGSLVSKFISEPDAGIYDAMNKGLRISSGAYVMFLNAGDRFSNKSALESCYLEICDARPLCVLCPVYVEYPGSRGLRLAKVKNPNSLFAGMPTSHQGIIYQLGLLRDFPFDISIKLAADFDQFVRSRSRIVKEAITVLNVPISVVEAGGVSDLKRSQSRQEYRKIIGRHVNTPRKEVSILYQYILEGYDKLASIVKAVLPVGIVHRVRMIK